MALISVVMSVSPVHNNVRGMLMAFVTLSILCGHAFLWPLCVGWFDPLYYIYCRVLRPPGGGSSNIFGGPEDTSNNNVAKEARVSASVGTRCNICG